MEDNLTVYTPADFQNESEVSPSSSARENVNMMVLYDDYTYIEYVVQTLSSKGVRIVEFPKVYDHASIVPFLLVNDHSIMVVRNPKKDILPLLKLIMRKGQIYFKQ